MLPSGCDQVVRRELVEQLDVGHQAGACEHALEQVVAEQRVVGDPVVQRGGERVDVVDPLAGEAALLEEVLVDVRDGGRIRVDAGGPGEGSLEDRGVLAGRQRGRDPWLQQAVTVGDPTQPGIEARLVERVGDRPDESPDDAARQSGVRVERDDVAHVRGGTVRGAGLVRKLVVVDPRNSAFSSWSLPRLRSQPIQRFSPAFHIRRRWKSRKRAPPPGHRRTVR